MSGSRIVAGAVALALGAAVVTALAGATPEENADRPAAAAKADQPATKVAPLAAKINAAKIDQPATNAARSLTFACPKEPWPYGCQWREPPTRRVTRGSRPAG
jgi:outer membrane murein-binding lipoprotein Lpp